jgi:hypothetical protein
VKWLR